MADTEEMFSSESESLYYRVRAIRDELERSEDEENDEVLFELLSTTMDMVDMKATSEYKDKVREIIVRKDDENVSTVLLHEKLLVGEQVGGIVLLAGGIIAAVVSLFGTGGFAFSIKAVIFLLLGIGAFIGCQFAKKMSIAKIQDAYRALEGKTIVGMKLKKRSFGNDDSTSAAYREIAGGGKKKTIIVSVTVLIIVAMLGVGGFIAYSKVIAPSQTYDNAEAKFLAKDFSGAYSLYSELSEDYKDTAKKMEALSFINKTEPDYINAIDRISYFGPDYADVMADLTEEKNVYFYAKGQEAYTAKNFTAAEKFFGNASGYQDADTKKENAVALGHYYEAEKLAEKSLYNALVELKKITNGIQDTNALIALYEKYVPITGKYTDGETVFNITGYLKKKNTYYVNESGIGDIPITESDKEEYIFMATLGAKTWYVNKDEVRVYITETYEEKGTEKERIVEKVLKKK